MWKHDLEHDRTATALPTVFCHSPAAGAEPLGFTPFFLSYLTANPSANSNSSTLKIYLEFHHFPSPSPWLPPWSNHYDLLPGLLQELPVSHLESNLHPAPTADPWIHEVRSCPSLLCSKPIKSFPLTQSQGQSPHLGLSLTARPCPLLSTVPLLTPVPRISPSMLGSWLAFTHQACSASRPLRLLFPWARS